MNEILYLYFLSSDQRDRLRVTAHKDRGEIVSFVVQYEAKIGNVWRAIVRYDTTHGFAHRDIIHPDGSQDKQVLYLPTQSIAFTYAIQDLKSSWRWYQEGFEREMSYDD